jgi:hypothetical protein
MHAYSVNDSLIAQYVQTDLVYLVLEAQLISLSPHDLIHLNTLPLFNLRPWLDLLESNIKSNSNSLNRAKIDRAFHSRGCTCMLTLLKLLTMMTRTGCILY